MAISGYLFRDRENIIEYFQEKGILVDPKALRIIMEKSLGTLIVRLVNNETLKNGYVREEDVLEIVSSQSEKFNSVREIDINSIKANSSVDDFRNVFVDRYTKLRNIVLAAGKLRGPSSIGDVRKLKNGYVKIVGMVSDVSITKNGHKKFRIEDLDDRIDVIITNKNPLHNELILNDEVLGVVGSKPESKNDSMKSEPVIFANEIIRPDVPFRVIDDTGREPEYVGSISDIHVGSKTFLKDSFNSMIKWIKSSGEDDQDRPEDNAEHEEGDGAYFRTDSRGNKEKRYQER